MAFEHRKIVAAGLPKAAGYRFLESAPDGFERRIVLSRKETRYRGIAQIGIVKMIEVFARNAAGGRGKGKARIDGRGYFGGPSEAVPHLPFEPARAESAAMHDARAFFLKIADAGIGGVSAIGMIKIGLIIAERLCGGGKTAFVSCKVKACEQIGFAMILNVEKAIRLPNPLGESLACRSA